MYHCLWRHHSQGAGQDLEFLPLLHPQLLSHEALQIPTTSELLNPSLPSICPSPQPLGLKSDTLHLSSRKQSPSLSLYLHSPSQIHSPLCESDPGISQTKAGCHAPPYKPSIAPIAKGLRLWAAAETSQAVKNTDQQGFSFNQTGPEIPVLWF